MRLAGAQGIELKRGPKSSLPIEAEFARLREKVAFLDKDRYLAYDIVTMKQWALNSAWPEPVENILPSHR